MPDAVLLNSSIVRSTIPERTFLGWDAAALPAAARHLADHYAKGDELRMREVTVVLPGGRAGRRLKELLVMEAERLAVRLIPPRITTIGALPEQLYRPAYPLATAALRRRAWARALRELPPERLAPLFAARPADSDLRGWGRLARILANLHRDVAGAGLRFQDVVPRCRDGGLLFADTERWSVLASVQAAYGAVLERSRVADPDLARIDAVDAGALALEHEIWLVGVIEMPGILRRMLENLPDRAGRVRVLVQAPAAEAAAFDEFGCIRPEAWSHRAVPLHDDQIAVRGRPVEQAAEVVHTLAALDGRYAAEEIVIAVPNPELVPYLDQQLSAAGVAVRFAGGTSVDRSPVTRLLAAFADYLDGGRFDASAALARHPDVWRWLHRLKIAPERDGWLEELDTKFAERLPTHVPLPALDDERLLGRMRGSRRLAAWVAEILVLVAEVYGKQELDRTRSADRQLLDACVCLRRAALELHDLPEELDPPCDAATAIRLLLDELHGVSIASDPDSAAVELLGWLEIRLDDAPVVVVSGFNEPFLPESVSAHPFLPDALRERLGLMDNASRYARDVYELTALLHSRGQVRVIAGRRGATGDPLRPSRLMFALEGSPLAERVRRFYGAEATPPSGSPVADPVGTGRFRMPAEPVLHAPQPIRTIPVTAFRQLLADPYAYALEKILGLTPMDDQARELDGMRFGSLAHEVLNDFALTDEVHSTDTARVRRRLDEMLDRMVLTHLDTDSLPAVRVQTEQLRARLHAFARWHADWIAAGWRVVGVECGTPKGGVAFDVDGEPAYLTGRIDRIDYHPERNEWAIFDYKTGDRGEGPDDTHRAGRQDDRHWTDLQLPLYRHLLAHVWDGHRRQPFTPRAAAVVRLGYILLPRDLDRVGAEFAPWSEDELESADDCARQVVRLLRENVFRFDPTHARHARNSGLSSVLGVGHLESALSETEEGEE